MSPRLPPGQKKSIDTFPIITQTFSLILNIGQKIIFCFNLNLSLLKEEVEDSTITVYLQCTNHSFHDQLGIDGGQELQFVIFNEF